MNSLFHLAFNVTDLDQTRHFYGGVLGCREARIDIILTPQLRFAGQPGEQWTMFFCDPFGNPIEVKGFAALDALYTS